MRSISIRSARPLVVEIAGPRRGVRSAAVTLRLRGRRRSAPDSESGVVLGASPAGRQRGRPRARSRRPERIADSASASISRRWSLPRRPATSTKRKKRRRATASQAELQLRLLRGIVEVVGPALGLERKTQSLVSPPGSRARNPRRLRVRTGRPSSRRLACRPLTSRGGGRCARLLGAAHPRPRTNRRLGRPARGRPCGMPDRGRAARLWSVRTCPGRAAARRGGTTTKLLPFETCALTSTLRRNER